MTDLLVVASLVVTALFVAVLCLFLQNMGKILGRTAMRLHDTAQTATRVRLDCELIKPSIAAMNTGLYAVAVNLNAVGELSERETERVSSQRAAGT